MFDKIEYNKYEDSSISIEVRNTLNYIINKLRVDLDNVDTEELDFEWSNTVANKLGDIAFKEIRKSCKLLEISEWTFSGRSSGYYTLTNDFDIKELKNANDYTDLEGTYFKILGNELKSNAQLRRLQNLLDSDLSEITKIIKRVVDTKGVEIIKYLVIDLTITENNDLNENNNTVNESNNQSVNSLAEKITDTYLETQDISVIKDALIQGLTEVYLPEDEDLIPGYNEYDPPYHSFISDLDLLERDLVRAFTKLKQQLYIKSGN